MLYNWTDKVNKRIYNSDCQPMPSTSGNLETIKDLAESVDHIPRLPPEAAYQCVESPAIDIVRQSSRFEALVT